MQLGVIGICVDFLERKYEPRRARRFFGERQNILLTTLVTSVQMRSETGRAHNQVQRRVVNIIMIFLRELRALRGSKQQYKQLTTPC